MLKYYIIGSTALFITCFFLYLLVEQDPPIGEIIIEVNSLHIDCFYHVYGERKDVDKLKVEYKGDTILEQGKPK